jgi:hypothetical protein
VGVAGEDQVYPLHPLGQSGVQLQAVVGEEDHGVRPLGPGASHRLLKLLLVQGEGKPLGEALGVGDLHVGVAGPHHGQGVGPHLVDAVGGKEGVAEDLVHDVVGEELPLKALQELLHPLPPQGPLPVGDHVVHPHQVLPVHDGLALGEEGKPRVGPGVPPVQEEDLGPPGLRLGPLLADEGGHRAKPADGAQGPGQLHEVQVGEKVGQRGLPLHPVVAQDGLPREVPGAAHEGLGGDQVGRLHEVVGEGLGVEVGEVKEGGLPVRREVVEALGVLQHLG